MSTLPGWGRHRKAQALPLPRVVRGQTGDPRGLSESGSKKKRKHQRRSGSGKEVLLYIFFGESQWNTGHFSMRKCESEKHQSWCLPAEGFKGHVATDGSLLGTAGKWVHAVIRWCSWIMMRKRARCMGCMARWRQRTRMQRTIKRAALTAFWCLLRKVRGPIKVHVDNKGIIDGLRKGEKECIQQEEQEMQTCG